MREIGMAAPVAGERAPRSRSWGPGKLKQIIEFAPHRINEPGSFGFTPLHFAADGNREAAVGMLLAAGAEVNKLDEDGCSPLWFANTTLRK